MRILGVQIIAHLQGFPSKCPRNASFRDQDCLFPIRCMAGYPETRRGFSASQHQGLLGLGTLGIYRDDTRITGFRNEASSR